MRLHSHGTTGQFIRWFPGETSGVSVTICIVVLLVLGGCLGADSGEEQSPKCIGPGCDEGEGGGPCQVDRDCPTGRECVDGSCRRPAGCESDEDCASGMACIEGSCYAQGTDLGYFETGTGSDGGGSEYGDDTAGRDVFDPGDVKNCSGCIVRADTGPARCIQGTEKGACGSGGETCKVCDDDEFCDSGECVTKPCTPTNCAGCCEDGTCKSGDSSMACGSDGETCDVCSGAAKCVDGGCEIVCGPDSCAGCCSPEGVCLDGDSADKCGSGGAECSSCAGDEACANGDCVLKECTERCSDGCCDGSTCRNGDTDQNCGRNGESCQTCGGGHSCSSGSCDVVDNSRWDIIGVSAEVPKSSENGVFWDSRGNNPDVFLEVKNEGYTTTYEGKTSVDGGDLTPFWYETTVSDARAVDLKRYNKTTLRLVDEDPWYDPTGNDEIAKCAVDLDERHFNGQTYEFICNDGVETTIRIKLRHHP